jgi:hypothetical protein
MAKKTKTHTMPDGSKMTGAPMKPKGAKGTKKVKGC